MRQLLAAAMAFGLLASIGPAVGAAEVEEGFVSLFNGQDLAGWVKRGGSAEYQVEDGCIVGKCVPDTPGNTFLCTEKEFGNFILRLQYKFLEPGNSGVQFRSAARPEGDHQSVYGYQYEMTPGGDSTGRIYDEGRRGHKFGVIWLDIYTPQERLDAAQASCKEGGVERRGNSVRWPVDQDVAQRQAWSSNMFDSFSMKGFSACKSTPASPAPWHGRISVSRIWARASGSRSSLKATTASTSSSRPGSFSPKSGLSRKTAFCAVFTPRARSIGRAGDFHREVTTTSSPASRIACTAATARCISAPRKRPRPWVLRGFQNEIANGGKDSRPLAHRRRIVDGKMIPGRGWVVSNDEFAEKVRNKDDQWNTTCARIATGTPLR